MTNAGSYSHGEDAARHVMRKMCAEFLAELVRMAANL